jgi:hypothetical protein
MLCICCAHACVTVPSGHASAFSPILGAVSESFYMMFLCSRCRCSCFCEMFLCSRCLVLSFWSEVLQLAIGEMLCRIVANQFLRQFGEELCCAFFMLTSSLFSSLHTVALWMNEMICFLLIGWLQWTRFCNF